ncbi:MAG TPA: glycosyltransferase family 2 protein [Candidatus Limnocylindria bacterium]|nr:glycosyltransferase family 2 protein [Candidatus Limnocylindria bacterium]
MRPLISVVIPAHNPGGYIEPCIRSLLRQSMSRDRFEVIFVDDGSTDGTGERLNRLAREQANVRVIHIPASGAPGRPRNIGLEAALGEYVQFLDADDELAPRALQRLLRMARTNDSDIVLGKFASETMTRRQDLFTRTRPATTLEETPALADASMGPTKLFRTALLRQHEISFPEGWRQMEDQLFTLRAYLAADVISVLADEPCYFFNKREDEGHISAELVDPASHVTHLHEILHEIEGGLPEGELRARFIGRFYRTEVLGRLTGPQFLEAPAAYQRDLFIALRAIAWERFGEGIHEGMGAIARIRSRLLLEGDLPELVQLGRRGQAFSVDARVIRAAWTAGRLSIEFRATLSRGVDAHPLVLVERDGAMLLDPAVAEDLVGPVDVTDELAAIRAQVSFVDRHTALEWIVPGFAELTTRPIGDPKDRARLPALVGFVELDPLRVGPGEQPLDDGTWDVLVRWSGLGMRSTGLLHFSKKALRAGDPPVAPALVGRPVRWIVPLADVSGAVRIGVGGPDRAPARINEDQRRVIRDGTALTFSLPVATAGPGTMASGVARLDGPGGEYDLPAAFVASLGSLLVSVDDVAQLGVIPRGRYELTAHVGGGDAPGLPLGAALVRDDGRFVVLGVARESTIERFRSWTSWTAREAGIAAWARARAAYRRMPGPAKDLVRSTYGRLRG